LTVVGGLAVVANTILRVRGTTLWSLACKTLCGVFFILVGATAVLANPAIGSDPRWLRLGVCVVLGLVAGLLGDIWLALKDLVPKDHDVYMFLGLAFFALGHVAFVAGLLATYPDARGGLVWASALAVVVAGGIVAFDKALKLDFGPFRWAAMAYGCTLCLMAALAFFAVPGAGAQPLVMGVGGVSFLVSDLVLASAYFGPGRDKAWNHALCYLFYYGAQFTIALSLLAV
jgi:hypothetical protein